MVFRTRTLLGALAISAAPLAASCGASDSVASTSGLDGADRDAEIAFDSLFTVGTVAGESWETFGRLSQMAFDSAGNLYIFDPDNYRIVVVDSSGSFVREIGKRGGGPGELQNPLGIAVAPDGTLAVADFGVTGFSIFDPSGTFTTNVRVAPEKGIPTSGMQWHPVDSAVVVAGSGAIRVNAGGPGRGSGRGPSPLAPPQQPTSIPIRKISMPSGEESTVHEAWRPPPPERKATEITGGNGQQSFMIRSAPQVAFQPRLFVGLLQDGRYVVADSVDYRVDILDANGAVAETLRRPIDPITVTEDMKEREKARRLEQLETSAAPRIIVAGGAGSAIADQMAQQLRQAQRDQLENLLFNDVIPVIAGLGVDWDDHIWVERAAEPGETGRIDIIDAGKRYYGSIPASGPRIPAAFGPNGLVAYLEKDELDVPSVRVMRVRMN